MDYPTLRRLLAMADTEGDAYRASVNALDRLPCDSPDRDQLAKDLETTRAKYLAAGDAYLAARRELE